MPPLQRTLMVFPAHENPYQPPKLQMNPILRLVDKMLSDAHLQIAPRKAGGESGSAPRTC